MKVVSHLNLIQPNCCVHSYLPMVPVLSQMNPVHILPALVVMIPFNDILTHARISASSKQVPTGTIYSFLSFPYLRRPFNFIPLKPNILATMGALTFQSLAVSLRFTRFNLLKAKRRLLYLKTQFVPRSKHFSSRL